MPATEQNIVSPCSRTVNGGAPTLASKTIGHGIAIPAVLFICGYDAPRLLSATFSDLAAGRPPDLTVRQWLQAPILPLTIRAPAIIRISLSIPGSRVNSASKTVTMTMDLAPGVSTTCTATGP
jgi:hypothetical protein